MIPSSIRFDTARLVHSADRVHLNIKMPGLGRFAARKKQQPQSEPATADSNDASNSNASTSAANSNEGAGGAQGVTSTSTSSQSNQNHHQPSSLAASSISTPNKGSNDFQSDNSAPAASHVNHNNTNTDLNANGTNHTDNGIDDANMFASFDGPMTPGGASAYENFSMEYQNFDDVDSAGAADGAAAGHGGGGGGLFDDYMGMDNAIDFDTERNGGESASADAVANDVVDLDVGNSTNGQQQNQKNGSFASCCPSTSTSASAPAPSALSQGSTSIISRFKKNKVPVAVATVDPTDATGADTYDTVKNTSNAEKNSKDTSNDSDIIVPVPVPIPVDGADTHANSGDTNVGTTTEAPTTDHDASNQNTTHPDKSTVLDEKNGSDPNPESMDIESASDELVHHHAPVEGNIPAHGTQDDVNMENFQAPEIESNKETTSKKHLGYQANGMAVASVHATIAEPPARDSKEYEERGQDDATALSLDQNVGSSGDSRTDDVATNSSNIALEPKAKETKAPTNSEESHYTNALTSDTGSKTLADHDSSSPIANGVGGNADDNETRNAPKEIPVTNQENTKNTIEQCPNNIPTEPSSNSTTSFPRGCASDGLSTRSLPQGNESVGLQAARLTRPDNTKPRSHQAHITRVTPTSGTQNTGKRTLGADTFSQPTGNQANLMANSDINTSSTSHQVRSRVPSAAVVRDIPGKGNFSDHNTSSVQKSRPPARLHNTNKVVPNLSQRNVHSNRVSNTDGVVRDLSTKVPNPTTASKNMNKSRVLSNTNNSETSSHARRAEVPPSVNVSHTVVTANHTNRVIPGNATKKFQRPKSIQTMAAPCAVAHSASMNPVTPSPPAPTGRSRLNHQANMNTTNRASLQNRNSMIHKGPYSRSSSSSTSDSRHSMLNKEMPDRVIPPSKPSNHTNMGPSSLESIMPEFNSPMAAPKRPAANKEKTFDELVVSFRSSLVESADIWDRCDTDLVEMRLSLCIAENKALRLHGEYDDLLEEVEHMLDGM